MHVRKTSKANFRRTITWAVRLQRAQTQEGNQLESGKHEQVVAESQRSGRYACGWNQEADMRVVRVHSASGSKFVRAMYGANLQCRSMVMRAKSEHA